MIKEVIRLVYPGIFQSFLQEESLSTNTILIRPVFGSICKADLRYFWGKRDQKILKQKLPMALIHESAAVVLFDPQKDFKPGQWVIPIPNTPENLTNKSDNWYCSNYMKETLFRSSGIDGYTQNLMAHRNDLVVTVPQEIIEDNPELSTFAEIISVAVHAIRKATRFPVKKKSFAIWGDGILGYISSLVVKMLFPQARLTCVIKHDERIDYFDHACNIYLTGDIPNVLNFDIGIECIGGEKSGGAINEMLYHTSPGSVMTLTGVSDSNVAIKTRTILEKGVTIIGSSRSGIEDFQIALKLLSNSWFRENILRIWRGSFEVTNPSELERSFKEASTLHLGKVILNFNF